MAIMKKLVNCCDECNAIGDHLDLILTAGKELCSRCVAKWNYAKLKEVREQNRVNANSFTSCNKCKHTGVIHQSIYAVGPGYYDEPDPTIYCFCTKGRALDPNTNYLVVEGMFID